MLLSPPYPWVKFCHNPLGVSFLHMHQPTSTRLLSLVVATRYSNVRNDDMWTTNYYDMWIIYRLMTVSPVVIAMYNLSELNDNNDAYT